MRSIRLFADVPLEPGRDVTLSDSAAAHAVRVLRLRAGDAVTLFNGDGSEYAARLVTAGPREPRAAVESATAPARESPLRITLLQAIARGEKMDWVIQKATELGVARIVPVTSERSEVKLDPTRAGKRLEHWRAVMIAACEQCGRNTLPRFDPPMTMAAWLDANPASPAALRWMLHPEGGTRLRDLQRPTPSSLVLAVGPEGGFGETDLAILTGHDFRGLALGPRILRTETAGVAAIAALQALYGDL